MINSDEQRIYPCESCGVLRSAAEGGRTFTVCDDCWDRLHGGLNDRLKTLAHNFAIVAALDRAFWLGAGFGYEWATREPFYPRWEPGCGQHARHAEVARKQPGAFADIYGDRSKWRVA